MRSTTGNRTQWHCVSKPTGNIRVIAENCKTRRQKYGWLPPDLYADLKACAAGGWAFGRFPDELRRLLILWKRRLAATFGSDGFRPLAATLGADGRNPTAPSSARPLRAEGKKALDGQKGKAQDDIA